MGQSSFHGARGWGGGGRLLKRDTKVRPLSGQAGNDLPGAAGVFVQYFKTCIFQTAFGQRPSCTLLPVAWVDACWYVATAVAAAVAVVLQAPRHRCVPQAVYYCIDGRHVWAVFAVRPVPGPESADDCWGVCLFVTLVGGVLFIINIPAASCVYGPPPAVNRVAACSLGWQSAGSRTLWLLAVCLEAVWCCCTHLLIQLPV